MKGMNWTRFGVCVGAGLLILSGASKAGGLGRESKVLGIDPRVKGEKRVIVGLKKGAPEGIISLHGGRVSRRLKMIDALATRLPTGQIFALAEEDAVAFIEPDYPVRASVETLPWGVDRIDAEAVHGEFTGEGARVAVVDTGVDYRHPDLSGNFLGGYDFVNNDADPMDDNGHGTHCAGIVAAEADGEGVIGVAPEAELYALKVLGEDGSGWTSDIIAAIEWAADRNVDVISMSLGGPGYSRALDMACRNAYATGVLLVAAAGNDYGDPVSYPAALDAVVAVSATDSSDGLARFSNMGPEVELAAPGVDILSTLPGGGYAPWSGTSMATPHVSGVGALVKSADRSLSNDAVRERMRDGAEDLGSPGRDDRFGYGLVNAEASVIVGEEGSVTVHIQLQGREDQSGAQVLVDGYEQTTPSDGIVTFILPGGQYTIQVFMDGYLHAEREFRLLGGISIELPSVTLLGGDANNDGFVDIFDLTIVGGAYGSSPPSDSRADMNGDGKVDLLDLTLVGGNYWKEAPGLW